MLTDPRVHDLAELFFADLLVNDLGRPLPATQRVECITRIAEAMQRAVEDECDLIRRDLEPWLKGSAS